jgi:uncharacterized protein YndB with AHSA1/START domain
MRDTIERTLELDAAVGDVWRALTDPTELSGWFGDTAELNVSLGAEGWFGWQQHGRFAVRVEELEPPRRFVWSWVHEAGKRLDEAPATRVEWTLTPRPDGGTTLHLRESGFRTLEHHRQNTQGWEEELGHLVEHLKAA